MICDTREFFGCRVVLPDTLLIIRPYYVLAISDPIKIVHLVSDLLCQPVES